MGPVVLRVLYILVLDGFGLPLVMVSQILQQSLILVHIIHIHSRLVSSPPLRLETVVCPKFSSGVSKNGTTGFIQLS